MIFACHPHAIRTEVPSCRSRIVVALVASLFPTRAARRNISCITITRDGLPIRFMEVALLAFARDRPTFEQFVASYKATRPCPAPARTARGSPGRTLQCSRL